MLENLPFHPISNKPWYDLLGYAVVVLAVSVATATLQMLLPLLSVAGIYLLYLLVVVGVSVGWGLKHGILASVLSFLAANFFFTDPLFTLAVSAVQDVIALVTFLALATLTSQLVSSLRRQVEEARSSQQITSTLYVLSQTLTKQQDLYTLLSEVASQLCGVLGLEGCAIIIRNVEGLEARTIEIGRPPQERQPQTPAQAQGQAGVASTPLLIGGLDIGELIIVSPPNRRHITEQERHIVAAFAEHIQIAIERAQGQQITLQSEVLRRTDALRVALLSAVAHDLRTPLSSIKMAATGLLDPPPEVLLDAESQRDLLVAIVEEVDRINRLVGNLLNVSRIENGHMRPHKEPYSIEELINTVLERLRPVLRQHRVTTRIEPGLQDVPMDVIQIDEVLTNLLENAAKYTPPGTTVEIYAVRAEGGIEVEIADRGPGIPPEHIPHLFSRFYRVSTRPPLIGAQTGGLADAEATGNGHSQGPYSQRAATRTPSGTGLGLAIIKGIIEAHGGRVEAANRAGGGASFKVFLPLEQQEVTKVGFAEDEAGPVRREREAIR